MGEKMTKLKRATYSACSGELILATVLEFWHITSELPLSVSYFSRITQINSQLKMKTLNIK
ncbi:hypothetical protein CWB66_15860 [Pseudoalteromonas sp. S558]|nr:hypothetical protein CWB66_15860 [Pseudoalteromonas sp. S558]